jgi:hypothetical protein
LPLPAGSMPGGYQAMPYQQPAVGPAARPPAPTGLAALPPKPTIRGQMSDELRAPEARPPAPAKPLAMPSPEQLGVAVRKSESNVDWNLVHRRFHDAGATCFLLDHRPEGGCKLTCLLPTGQPNRTHHIEVEAATEAEIARLALERLEEWKMKN